MSGPWVPEIEVDEALARRLVRAVAPELADDEISRLGVGWDNVVYRVGPRYVFRFPQRALGAPNIAAECAALPAIAAQLTAPVPVPEFIGQPLGDYPWPYAGCRYLPGRTACRAALSPAERERIAEPLAHILRELHDIDPEPLELRDDFFTKLDPSRAESARRDLAHLESAGQLSSAADFEPFLQDLPSGSRPRRVVHGDLYARHILVDDHRSFAGIIDWGDVLRGDPAVDLSLICGFLPRPARERFRGVYGEMDADTWRLARFRAVCHAAATGAFSETTADQDLLRECRHVLAEIRGS
ncbi:MAG: phosphotransferase [Planctomycetota bacterium]